MDHHERVGLMAPASVSCSEGTPSESDPAAEIKRVPSIGVDTPPVTPPLSVASYHGSTTSVSSSSNNNTGNSHADYSSIINSSRSRGRGRKRPRRKSLAGHSSAISGNDNDNDNPAADYYGERRFGEVAPPFSSSLASPPYFPVGDGSDGDGDCGGGDYGGNRKRPVPVPPRFQTTKTRKSPPRDSGRRRRRRCCCRLLGGRCLLVVGLCLLTAYLAFKTVWYFQWQARCVEGCYDPSMAKTGSRGPEQVHIAYSGVDADGNPTGMAVVWTTAAGEASPVVEYGLSKDDLSLTATGTSVSYLDTVHHRASLEGLAAGTRYFYRCGNPDPDTHPSEADGTSGGAVFPSLDVTLVAEEGEGGEGGEGGEEDGEEGAGESGVASGLRLGGLDESEGPSSSETSTPGVRGARGGGGGAIELRDAAKWSRVFSFETAPEAQRWEGDGPWDRPVSVAVVGDMGLVNAGATFDRLHQLVDDNEIDFILHLGDIGYADDSFLERPWSFGFEDKWDAFMRRTSHEFASKVPYMVVPGNHEAECHSPACLTSPRRRRSLGNFAAFNARFRMPSLESGADHGASMWYSFNVGPVHFVVVDTETDFPGAGGDHLSWAGFEAGSADGRNGDNGGFGDQIAWLEEDLDVANQERDVRPWIIVAGHRPMYATEKSDGDGLMSFGHSNRVREAFEPILEKNKVDAYLSGHVHAFERSFPVLDNVPLFNNGGGTSGGDGGGEDAAARRSSISAAGSSSKMVYEDPVAPVHIVNGAGGCLEGFTVPAPVYPAKLPEWRAMAMSYVPGVGILTFPSKAEMRSTFLTSDSPAEILDELTVRHQRAPLV
eukprot:g6891.t1